MTEPDLRAFVQALPKVELHLHLEGAIEPETLRELARSKGRLERETGQWIADRERTGFRYGNFAGFLEAFKLLSLLLETPADYALATTRLMERLAAENVVDAEVTLSTGVLLWKKQSVDAVFEAIAQAADEAEAHLGVRVRWIFDAIRQFGTEHAREVLRWAARCRPMGVVAFGIGGDETRGPAAAFADVYREARDLGLHTTAHAGETAGPASVRDAIEKLGAERIGHGLTAAADPATLRLLRDERIPLEVCITSNVATGLLPDSSAHPLREFLKAGVPVTLNSDDPAMFRTSLSREFLLAAEGFSLSRRQIVDLCETAARSTFLTEREQQSLVARVHAAASPTGLARTSA